MRRATLLLALFLAAAAPAAALPARFDIVAPPVGAAGDLLAIDILRAGDWDEAALIAKAREGYLDYAWITVTLDGAPLSTLTLALEVYDPDTNITQWLLPRAWRLVLPSLAGGVHELVASYVGDAVNRPEPAVWAFPILGSPTAGHPRGKGGPILTPPPVDPTALPQGPLTFTDLATGQVWLRPLAELLLVDPVTGARNLDLSWLTADTLVSYGGDGVFAAFSFTHEAVAAPPAPTALALAALAVLRIGRRRLLQPPGPAGTPPCPTPTSSTCASTPAIR